MSVALQENFWSYRECMRRWMRGGEVDARAAESKERYGGAEGPLPLDERLAQTIWAQQLFGSGEMRLVDGRGLRVLDPGRWNGSAGPDFQGARLLIDGETLRGDVEIHLRPGDWSAHGHQRDLDYNGVILHAVLHSDDGAKDDPLHNGRRTPRLEMEPYIFPDLETLRRSLSVDDFQYAQPSHAGKCQRLMTETEAAWVVDYLDRAGEERLIAKTRRLEEQARQAEPEQVFYQSVMMSLGAGAGKTLYYLLAKRTPLSEIMDFARESPRQEWNVTIEALLLAVAGLLPEEDALADAPEESRARAALLRDRWAQLESYWSDRPIPPTRRWFQGIRPVNFPTRRLAAMAILLARAMTLGRQPLEELLARIRAGAASLEDAVPSRKRHPLLTGLIEWFVVPGEGHFWGTHYSFTAKASARTMTLIGEATALSLVFNALLPAGLLAARREGDAALESAVFRLFSLAPPLQPNHVTEFMLRRLFGDAEQGRALANTERRRQGLFQIFQHCCNGEERHCDACYYLTS
jgi:hypothetical protein